MRIRSTKPEFWGYRGLTSLPYDLRLLVMGLWSYVDDNGVGVDDYRKVASDLFGTDDDPVAAREFVREGLATLSLTLDQVTGKPLLYRYTVGGRSYLFGTTWEGDLKQRVDHPNKPRYPRYDDPDAILPEPLTSDSANPREGLANTPATPPPGTGEQGNRGTGEQEETPATATPSLDTDEPALIPEPPRKPKSGSDDDPDWCKFWDTYPRKDAKDGARVKWRAALGRKGVTAALIIAGAQRYRDDPNRSDEFTKLPTSWLNQGCWNDGSLPTNTNGYQPYRDPDPSAYDGDL